MLLVSALETVLFVLPKPREAAQHKMDVGRCSTGGQHAERDQVPARVTKYQRKSPTWRRAEMRVYKVDGKVARTVHTNTSKLLTRCATQNSLYINIYSYNIKEFFKCRALYSRYPSPQKHPKKSEIKLVTRGNKIPNLIREIMICKSSA